MSGAWPGRIPRQPLAPGNVVSTTGSRSNWRSGVTIANSMESGSIFTLGAHLHLFGLFQSLVNRADHIKRLLRNIVVLALDNFFETADGVFDFHVLALKTGELRGHEHGLREEFFD